MVGECGIDVRSFVNAAHDLHNLTDVVFHFNPVSCRESHADPSSLMANFLLHHTALHSFGVTGAPFKFGHKKLHDTLTSHVNLKTFHFSHQVFSSLRLSPICLVFGMGIYSM